MGRRRRLKTSESADPSTAEGGFEPPSEIGAGRAGFLSMREHEEFEVETDKPGEWPVPFSSDTVRQVVVE